ncbi:hypothetical protein OCGS_0483 [Oceaniovalibus guishaninsula JLT2003]|uniref:Uncharacterized protein n=1 Tax=Oceaniovalibus guishaninsula JLT2003 TaxID=1231392 RepID=K2HD59_9RHOB|nr:hypothetical protein OCGS_0483 [Oceaniovalibus guishaninsula JLT2003]
MTGGCNPSPRHQGTPPGFVVADGRSPGLRRSGILTVARLPGLSASGIGRPLRSRSRGRLRPAGRSRSRIPFSPVYTGTIGMRHAAQRPNLSSARPRHG